MDLPLIAAGVIGFGLFMYVLLDGFDLGLGALFLFMPEAKDRDVAIDSVAPIWDGNETWLVLGGVGLFGAFPLAYATLLPALYVPVMVMLFALIFRGVAFEYRAKAVKLRWAWDWGFAAGSTIAAFFQGVMLGAVLGGFRIEHGGFVGGPFDWVSPFALMSGAGLVCGYALLGAAWLVLKTEGGLRDWAFLVLKRLMPVLALFILLVSVWTPLQHPAIAARWFAWPNLLYLSPVPIATAVLFLTLWRAVAARRELAPFLLAIGLFALSYAGLAISLYPHIVPPEITVWQAAAPKESLEFLLIGVAVLLPIILVYTAHNYWVFRGKVRPGEGYH